MYINKKYMKGRKFTEEERSGIISDYCSGKPLKEIKTTYKTSSETIYKFIDAVNIPRKNSKDLSKFYNLEDREFQY